MEAFQQADGSETMLWRVVCVCVCACACVRVCVCVWRVVCERERAREREREKGRERERGGESDVQFLDPVSQVCSRSESSVPI